ncbi:MAG: flagellar biosynthesis anti-sigma factor FlgM [Gemmatimonadota bacterium]
MRINGSSSPIRPDRPSSAASPEHQQQQRTPEVDGTRPSGGGAVRSDSVRISSAGRSLAGRVESESRTNFDPERVAELRSKVLTGAYNTLDVVDQVARRILSRGDL